MSKTSFNTVEGGGGINWVEELRGGDEEEVEGIWRAGCEKQKNDRSWRARGGNGTLALRTWRDPEQRLGNGSLRTAGGLQTPL